MPQTQKGDLDRHYAIFLSYKHADNKEQRREWATWLHQALESYEIPADLVGTKNSKGDFIPASLYPVFRDEEELPADADLTRNIEHALENSDLLVVICSPRAAESKFVAAEIRYFKELGKADSVLAIMIDGEPNASNDPVKAKLGIGPDAECLPKPLRYGVAGADGKIDWNQPTEPIAADARPKGNPEQGWTTGAAYREALQKEGRLSGRQIAVEVRDYEQRLQLAKLKVIAGAIGVPLGILTERDEAMQLLKAKQRSRILRRWLAAVGVLGVLTLAGAIYAWRQKQNAQRAQAQAQSALDETRRTFSNSDFLQALRSINEDADFDALAQLARSLSFNRENRAALTRLVTLLTYRDYATPLLRLELDDEVGSAEFSPDRKRILTAGSHVARVWDAETGRPLTDRMQHGDFLTSAEFSSDGKRIVTVCGDPNGPGYMRVWDAEKGIPLLEPIPHKGRVASAHFSRDGKRIVTASTNPDPRGGEARVWNAETGKPLTGPMQHDADVESAEFSPDGTQIVTASGVKESHGFAQVWDAKSGKPITAPIKHDDRVGSAEFSPDGKRIVTSCENQTARVWDARTGKPLTEPIKHEDRSEVRGMSARFSPDGKWIVTGSTDQTARVWDAETGKPVSEPMKHEAQIESVEFNPDGKRILTASIGTARVWDAETGRPLTGPMKHGRDIHSATFSVDGRRIVTASFDKTVRVWDGQMSRALVQRMKQDGGVEWAQFSPDGKRIVTASSDRRARVWDAETAKQMTETMQFLDAIQAVQFSPDGKRIVTSSGQFNEPGQVRVWNSETGEPLTEPITHETEIRGVEFSRDGKRIVTAYGPRDGPGSTRVWNADTGKALTEPMKDRGSIESVRFSPDGKRIVTASEILGDKSGEARVWDSETGKPLIEAIRGEVPFRSAEFSPDGKRILTAANHARVWDAETGKPLTQPINGDAGDIWSAHFSPDGKRIVTAATNGARVWDANNGTPLTEPMGNEVGTNVDSAQFSPDGKRIVTASSQFPGQAVNRHSGVRIWDTETGKPLTDVMPGSSGSLQFSPDGRRLVTATGRVWDIAPAGTAWPAWLPRLADALAGQHMSDRGFFDPLARDSIELIRKIKEEIAREPVDNDWAIWGRWFLADRSTRTISPFSKVTVPEYIEERIQENTEESLDEAARLALGNAKLLKRIADAREALQSKTRQ
jgi:WD40 repeat protein